MAERAKPVVKAAKPEPYRFDDLGNFQLYDPSAEKYVSMRDTTPTRWQSLSLYHTLEALRSKS